MSDSSQDSGSPPRLALRAAEAAESLGISERLLWSKTNAGEVPHIRIGRAILYPVDGLRNWLHQQAETKGGRHDAHGHD